MNQHAFEQMGYTSEDVKQGINTLDLVIPEQRERVITVYLNGIEKAGNRASKIIRNMLAFSRKSSGNRKAIDINDLLNEVLGLSVSYFIITGNHGGSIFVESAFGKGTTLE